MKPLALAPHIRETLARLEPPIASAPLEHLYVIDSYGRVVGHRVGTKNRVRPTKKLVAWMKRHPLGFITTHNHPRGFAHSAKDVEVAMRRYGFESRVVTEGKVFRVQPKLRLTKSPSRLYRYQAALDAKAERMSPKERNQHLLRLYETGIERVRLSGIVRFGSEPLPEARANPRDACACCAGYTVHL